MHVVKLLVYSVFHTYTEALCHFEFIQVFCEYMVKNMNKYTNGIVNSSVQHWKTSALEMNPNKGLCVG